ncbi:MAG: hypothetical protein Kow0090_14690 [Myxococcota bacterium]
MDSKKILISLFTAFIGVASLVTLFASYEAYAQRKGAKPKATPAKAAAQEEGKEGQPIGPTIQYEKYRQQVEQRVAQVRDQQIEDIQQILKLKPTEDELPDLYFRLAELYWEKSQYYWFQTMEITIDPTELEKKTAKAMQQKKQKDDLLAESKKWREVAINYYERILQRFKNYKRYDEVIFFLGYNYWENNEHEKALQIYRELVRLFPNSQFIPEVYLAFGEYYFTRGSLDKALSAYEKVVQYKESNIYGYALYKMAWVYYNLGEWERALDVFRQCIVHAETRQTGEEDVGRIALKKEALKDYVLTYSQTGEFERARDNFMEVGGEDNYFTMTQNLAQLYFDQGKDKEAIYVYKVLIKEDEANPRVLKYQARVIQAAQRIGNKPYVIEKIQEQVNYLAVFKEKVIEDPQVKEEIAQADKETEDSIQTIAKLFHDEANRTKKRATYEYARDVYALYLSAYPKTEKSYETRFFYAELLYKLNEYDKAAEQYQLTFNTDPKGKYTSDCLYNIVLAYEILAKEELRKATKGLKKKGLEPQELPEVVKKLQDAAKQYVRNLKSGDHVVKCKYIIANIFYLYNHFDKANRRFARIALLHPKSDEAEKAMNLFLDTFNLVQDWASLNMYARKFYANKELMGASKRREEQLAKIIEESAFKMVEPVEKAEDHKKAAEMYMAFVKEFPQSKLADAALHNASVNMDKSGQITEAVATREKLIADYPKSNLVKKCRYLNILAYENMAEFEKAAELSEEYVKLYRGDKANLDLIYNAGVYRESLSQYEKAEENFAQFVKLTYKPDEYCPVYWKEAKLFSRLEKHDKALAKFKNWLAKCKAQSADQTLEAMLYIANDYARKNDQKRAQAEYKNILKEFVKYRDKKESLDKGGTLAAAEARFHIAEVSYENYAKLKLEAGKTQLAKSFQKKQEAFGQTAAEFKDVVEFKQGDWAVAALYRIGTIGENFIAALRAAPVPKGLTKDQEFIYKETLELEYIVPVEKNTVEYFAFCLQKAQELNVYTPYTLKCKEKLIQYNPEEFSETSEIWGGAEFASEVPNPQSFITKLIEDRPKPVEKTYIAEEDEDEDEEAPEKKANTEEQPKEKKNSNGAKTPPSKKGKK